MAVSKAQICNMALAHIKQTLTTIANLDSDTGNTAVNCRIHYDTARQFVLAGHDWNFATKRKTLADISPATMSPVTWGYRYAYPSDCIKFQEIERLTKTSVPVKYKIEAKDDGSALSILTDMEDARAVYTFDLDNTSMFSPGFISALSWYLASELAPALSGSETLQQACLAVYSGVASRASSQDSQQQEHPDELDSPWDRARA
jgi:hypothetical protein